MEFDEKARIRLEHWMRHGRSHLDDYQSFAAELAAAGKTTSAEALEEMVELTRKGLDSLNRAVEALDGQAGEHFPSMRARPLAVRKVS